MRLIKSTESDKQTNHDTCTKLVPSCNMNILPRCRKLPAAIVFALLLCLHGQNTWAQSSGWGSPSGGSSSGSANAESNSSGGSGNGSAQASGSLSGSSGGVSVSANASVSSSGGGGSSSGSSSGSSLGGGSSSSSNDGPSSSGSASSNVQVNTSAASQATPAWLSSTPKPEGLLGRIKDAVKTSVENLTTGSAKKEENKAPSSGPSAGPSQMPTLGSGESQSTPSGGAGIIEKMGEAGKKVKDMVKDGAKEVKDDVRTIMGATGSRSDDKSGSSSGSGANGGSGGGFSLGGSVKIGENSLGGNMQIGSKSESKSGGNPLSKLMHKVEDKASDFTGKLMGDSKSGGGGESKSSAGASGGGSSPGGGDGKSTTVEVFDKIHEVSKEKVEAAMKPIDKALGFDKDPLIKMYDNSHEMMRKPLEVVSKPVEQVFSGAFKTSDEAKRDQERSMSEHERREMKLKEERARKEGRSVLGEIADKTFELVEKPYEIILKPVDRMLGFDKDGQKDPLIKLIDEIYNMSRKPIDVLAKPLENILKKMAEGEQAYQVSVRVNSESSAAADPKLFTRLADGALNIADRVVTKPLEVAMRPLGYDGQKKKNPIVESTHQLKNATKLGFELFTKPMDRIIKEISDIGISRSEAEQEADRERRRQEASRIVRLLDRLHEAAQTPWEIVLRPVSRALGYSREGKKEPFLRAWDVVHQVVRTPIQVVSKPVEDALLGERRQPPRNNVKAEVKIGSKTGVQGKAQIGSGSASTGKKGEEHRKNIFTDGIKKIEEFASKPFVKITSPIRKLILGEDGKDGGGVKAKATVNTPGGQAQAKAQVGGPSSGDTDKLVKTVENINNVVLKPLEVVTQPISDLLASDEKDKKSKEGGIKVQAQVKSQSNGGGQEGGQSKVLAAASAQARSGSSDGGQNKMSASASAQIKKN